MNLTSLVVRLLAREVAEAKEYANMQQRILDRVVMANESKTEEGLLYGLCTRSMNYKRVKLE